MAADDVDLDDIYDEARSNYMVLVASTRIAKLCAGSERSAEMLSNLVGADKVVGKCKPCQLELKQPRKADRASQEILNRSYVSKFDYDDL